MFCIYAIAMDPERKGHLYKVTGETLEELWNKLQNDSDKNNTVGNKPLSPDLLVNVAAENWNIQVSAIKFLEVTHDHISRGDLKVARYALGVNRPEFEALMGIKDRTISAWTQGKWPIPPGIGDRVHRLLKEQDEAVELVAEEYQNGRKFVYGEIYFDDKPLRWNKRVLQRAMVDYGVEILLEGEAT
jgi:DNA-binding transcriptional regulator YiaG